MTHTIDPHNFMNNKDYNSPIEKVKFNIRSFARQVAPWIHL